MEKRLSELLVCVLLFVMVCFSEEAGEPFISLQGALPEILSSGDKPYLVTGDILVSSGAVVTIEPGTVLLFNEFTGLHVEGTLHVKGNGEKPVVFTSKNDTVWNKQSSVNPAPFDWAGIDIHENAAEVSFSDVEIRYSVHGIQSHIDNVSLENCAISRNGKVDFSVKGMEIVSENSIFNYKKAEEKPAVTITKPTVKVEPTAKQAAKPVAIPKAPDEQGKESRLGKNIFRYCGLAVGVGGAGLAAFLYTKFVDSNDKFHEISTPSKENYQKFTSEDWESAKKERNRDMILTGVSGGIAVLGLASFGISFAF
ncbi:MAG: hypothetical protein Q4F84_08805 [Fibrobacter sp.]|nr:hypothetical protein [Fibrobacter sp.]